MKQEISLRDPAPEQWVRTGLRFERAQIEISQGRDTSAQSVNREALKESDEDDQPPAVSRPVAVRAGIDCDAVVKRRRRLQLAEQSSSTST